MACYNYNYNNDDDGDDDTHIAPIRRCSKCANAYQHQTEMFQFVLQRVQRDVCRPQIVWQAVLCSWSADKEVVVAVTCPCPCDA